MKDTFSKLREITGLSFNEIAVALNVSMSTVWRWEEGLSTPRFKHLDSIKALIKSTKNHKKA